MSILAKIAGKISGATAGPVVKEIIAGADSLFTSKEERAELEIKLTEAVNKHVEALRTADLEEVKAHLADTDSARQMQITALQQEDKFSKRFIYYLASFVLLSSTGFGIALTFVEIPEGNRRLIEMFADIYLFAGAIMVLQFFFGNSHKKDKTN
jgi:hypothetical protein